MDIGFVGTLIALAAATWALLKLCEFLGDRQ